MSEMRKSLREASLGAQKPVQVAIRLLNRVIAILTRIMARFRSRPYADL